MMIKEMRSEDKPRERFAKAPDTAKRFGCYPVANRSPRVFCYGYGAGSGRANSVVHGCQWI